MCKPYKRSKAAAAATAAAAAAATAATAAATAAADYAFPTPIYYDCIWSNVKRKDNFREKVIAK